MTVKDQKHTDSYSIYNADCMEVLPQLDSNSIDLVIYSPPFCGLYAYSSDARDFSNCTSRDQFLDQYEFLLKELSRVTKPGRINAVHCTDIHDHSCRLWDFPHEIIRLHKKHGFDYRSRITIWKEPLRVRTRTMVQSLMHKYLMEDSTKCFPAMPDYILVFTRVGENQVPVTHPFGIQEYAGSTPVLPEMCAIFNRANNTNFSIDELWAYLLTHRADNKVTKYNHFIYQRYSSAIWDDIRVDNILPFKDSKENDDEKHVHPLQLDVIDRLVELYSNPGEIVLTPFMGVSSEVFAAVKKSRKGVGIELKTSYYHQSILNLQEAERLARESHEQISFDEVISHKVAPSTIISSNMR